MAKILVIDDDPQLLRMIELALERRGGYEPILSADGAEALAKAREDPPDLAIVDVMMPGLTGYEVCRQLREQEETASIPIIILTARGQAVDRQAALEAGADEHVAKPVTMSELLERIDDVLADRSTTPSSSRIITLLSLRGGVGVTTLAVNLAATLARGERGRTCLVDLCASSGHGALQLGLRPEPNWSDLLDGDELDDEAVANTLLEHESGLHLLASPVLPLIQREISGSTVTDLLDALSREFEFLIVDTPSTLSEATMSAVGAATGTCLVVAGEPASVQTTLGTIRALGERGRELSIIVNQNARAGQASSESIERVIGRSVTGVIPFDPGQARALVKGKPLPLSRPDSPLATAVNRLAEKLV
jgi:MinD-like ATPase involved in chromosome partitioning or flagellar assembly/CheY-like chemotaxis protein